MLAINMLEAKTSLSRRLPQLERTRRPQQRPGVSCGVLPLEFWKLNPGLLGDGLPPLPNPS
jgi:hypothetical protein